jgi:CRISPR-associated protein Cst2
MSTRLFGLVVTPHGTAANNRGETESGNVTTLQKILWAGEVHTTVSAETIRWAIRWYWQRAHGPDALNRRWDDDAGRHEWDDAEFTKWAGKSRDVPLDDDVLGFMSAQAAKSEGNDAEHPKGKGRARGTIEKRRARLEVSRAISLTPFAGDITFNVASIGATPAASRTGQDPVPYATEVHATRYQYGFALTPAELRVPTRALDVVDAIINLSEVAGNHARFLFDFSPDTVVFRWTDDFAPRMLYGFALSEDGKLTIPEIRRRVEAGDIDPREVIVGGALADLEDGKWLRAQGASVHSGVKPAGEEMKQRIRASLKAS